LFELWIIGPCGVYPGSVVAVGVGVLAADDPLSLGSHLIEYKLLVSCFNVYRY